MIFRLSLFLISLAASPPGLHVQAGDVRIGSEVVFKGRDGVKIGDHPAGGHWAYVRYTVKDISSGRVRIASGSVEGWVDAHEIVPLDGAVDYFTRLIGDNPRSAWIYARRGAIRVADRKLALADLDEAIRLDPKLAPAYCFRAALRIPELDFDRAIADLDEAIRFDPRYTVAFQNRGVARLGKGENDSAIADFDQVVRLDPKYLYVYRERGLARLGRGDFAAAIKDFDESLRLEPGDLDARFSRGNAYLAIFDYDRAIIDYNDVVPHAKTDLRVLTNRGLAYARKKEFTRAIADYNEAIRLDPKLGSSFLDRGLVWAELNELDKALADLDRSIELLPNNPISRVVRGKIRTFKHNPSGACADFEVAIRLAPEDAETLNSLAWLLATCRVESVRDGRKAMPLARRACELTAWKNAFNLDSLAASYAETGDFTQALEWQTKALSLATNDKDRGDFQARLELYRQKKPYREGK